jgi:hypothetical protein
MQISTEPLNTMTPSFSAAEKELLRSLAAQAAELAARPEQKTKADLWTRHNDLDPCRPLVFCHPENGWNEIIPPASLVSSSPLARDWEMSLRRDIFSGGRMGDDRVISGYFNVPWYYESNRWGIHEKRIGGENGGAYTWEAPLHDYEVDFPKLRFPVITVDTTKSAAALELAHELFDDVLKVRRHTYWWWSLGMTRDYIDLRGMDDFMLDMYDNPDWIHKTMAFLRDGTLAKLDFLEKHNLLSHNRDDIYVGSGGFGWTRQLPAPNGLAEPVRTAGMWGFAESQETVGVSPEMFEEFVFPYQMSILERFGLNCYGCCEPLDKRWHIVKRIPRLRRVSVSPWADIKKMAEMLGGDYVFSWKPSPNPLATGSFDEDETRKSIRNALDIAKRNGCHVEMIMKDTHTFGGKPENAVIWSRIARQEAERW